METDQNEGVTWLTLKKFFLMTPPNKLTPPTGGFFVAFSGLGSGSWTSFGGDSSTSLKSSLSDSIPSTPSKRSEEEIKDEDLLDENKKE